MTPYMTIRYNGLKREMASSKQALGILFEYGKSKPRVWQEYGWSMLRVWLEYGWSMARVWLEHLFFRQERTFGPSGTNSFSVGNGLRSLRYAVMVILLMVVGVSEVWGQTPDYSGTYYIGSDYQTPSINTRNYDPTDLTNNFYLCPTENWISFGSSGETKDTWTTGDDKPFLTTYKACLHANDLEPYDLTKAKWTIEYYTTESSKDYYYIKHSSGKYVVLNKQIDGVSGSSPGNRIRVHLETLTSEQLADEDTRKMALFKIEQNDRSIIIRPKTLLSWQLTVNNGNGDYLRGDGTSKGSITSGSTTYGLNGTIGIYNNDNDDNKYLYLEEVKCFTPTISFNNSNGELTITSNTVGATIKYTTDGTDPSAGTTYDDSNKPVINTRTVVKAIAQKTYKEDSEVITQTIVVSPVIDPIASVTYNGSEQEPTVTVKDGETVISADEYTVSYSDNRNVGTATITITGKDGGNYILSGSTTFSITKAPVTVTADPKSKGYGDADPELTFTTTALQGSDTKATAFTGALTRKPGEAKGTYAITQGTLASANYEITFVGADFTITNKTLTITAGSDTKVYDGTALTKNTYTSTSLLEGDVIESVTVTGSQTKAGSSANVPSGAVIKNGSNEDVKDNYEITYVNGTLTVTQKPITITADDATKVYDGTPLTKNTYTSTALVSGDAIESVTVTGSQTVAGTSDNVPSAAVIKNSSSENVTSCYDITYTKGTLTITQKAMTITADDATKVYDGTALTKNTFTNTELASGDNITSVTFSGSQTVVGSSANVPSAAVIKNGSNENVSASYNITYTNGTLEVTRASVTVTADDASKIYGESDPASFTATVTGMVNNESESLITINSISRAEGEDAGNYTITPAGDVTQGNYAVSYVTGTFTISPKSMGDGNIPAVGITIVLNSSGELTEVKDGVKILTCDTDYTYTTATDGSDKVVTVTGKGNYKDSAKGLYANPVFIDPDGNGSEMAAAVYEAKRDMANPSNITPYIVRKVNPTIGTLTISPLGYIPEGVPVLLLSDTEAEGFTASPKDDSTPEITDEVRSSNKLMVSDGGVSVKDAQAYIFYRGEFVLTKEGTIGKDKFFVYNPNYNAKPDNSSPLPAPRRTLRLVIEEEEDPDSINEELRVKSEEFVTTESWYTIDGRKLNGKPTQKGMYINGGKKVIITSQQGNR